MSDTSMIHRFCSLLFAITLVQSMEQNDRYDTIENIEEINDDSRSIKSLNFPSFYHATGTITIPSGGIVEPFEAWYAGKHNKSRIDYYGGTVKTFQRADIGEYGTLYEVIPKYDFRKDSHYQGCWKKKGKKKKKIEPQNILPKNVYWPFKMNISQYKYKGTETIQGIPCTKWIAVTTFLNRTDTYTFHATDEENPRPVKFDMKGYDILLTSYYDHYIVEYETFEKWDYEKEKFHIPQVAKRDRWCQKVPKDIGEAGYRSLNPMGEFLNERSYEDFEDKFNNYKRNFGKEYKEEQEHRKRMHITRHNMRYIHSMNRRQLGYNLDVNHFTDLSGDEFNNRRGLSHDDDEEIEEYEKSIPVFDNDLDENERGFGNENGLGSGSGDEQVYDDEGQTEEYEKIIPVQDENFDEIQRGFQDEDGKSSGSGNDQEAKGELEFKHDRKNRISHKLNKEIKSRTVSKKSNIENNNVENGLSDLNLFANKLDDLSHDLNEDKSKRIIHENRKKDRLIDNSTKPDSAAKESMNSFKGQDNSQVKNNVVDDVPRENALTNLYQAPNKTASWKHLPIYTGSNYGTNIQTWQNFGTIINGLTKSTVPNVNGVMINHNIQNGQQINYVPTAASLNYEIQNGQLRENVPAAANVNHNIQNYVPTVASLNHYIENGQIRNKVPFDANINHHIQNGQNYVPTVPNLNHNTQYGQFRNTVPFGAYMNPELRNGQLRKNVPTIANMNNEVQNGQQLNYVQIGNHMNHDIQSEPFQKHVPTFPNGYHNIENGKLRNNVWGTTKASSRILLDNIDSNFYKSVLTKALAMVDGVNAKRHQENHPPPKNALKNQKNGNPVSSTNRFKDIQTDKFPEKVNRTEDKSFKELLGARSPANALDMVNGIKGGSYKENKPESMYLMKTRESGVSVSSSNRFNNVHTDRSSEKLNRNEDKNIDHFAESGFTKVSNMVNGVKGKIYQENDPSPKYSMKKKENGNSVSTKNTFKNIQSEKPSKKVNKNEDRKVRYFGGVGLTKALGLVDGANGKSYQGKNPASRYYMNTKVDHNAQSFSNIRTSILPENVNNVKDKTADNYDRGMSLEEGKESIFGHENDFANSRENFKSHKHDVKVEDKNLIKSTQRGGKFQTVNESLSYYAAKKAKLREKNDFLHSRKNFKTLRHDSKVEHRNKNKGTERGRIVKGIKNGFSSQETKTVQQRTKENLNAENINAIKNDYGDQTTQDFDNSFSSRDEGKTKLVNQDHFISRKVSLDTTANSSKRSERIVRIKQDERKLKKIDNDPATYNEVEDGLNEDSDVQNSWENHDNFRNAQDLVHLQNESNVNFDDGSGSVKDSIDKFSTSEKKKHKYESPREKMRGKLYDRLMKKKDKPNIEKYKHFEEPRITTRILKQTIKKPLSSFYEYSSNDYENRNPNTERKDSVEYSDKDNENIWRQPDTSEMKPFYMFGVDEMGNDGQDLETLEEDLLMKDDDRFPKEFRAENKGRVNRERNKKGSTKKKKQGPVPKELDWRDYGAVAPVQSQGICGSCWTFSTTAAVESAHFLKTGERIKLSEQQLLDCTWYVPHSKEGNHGCMGGWTWKSFAYIKKFGLATYDSYGQYLGMEGSCKTKNLTVGARIDSFMKVKANSPEALKRAIAYYGPATASINTEVKTLKFYKNGIYSDKECNGATDHSVLIVGYGEENGKLYWIVKNSWGTRWGENGYVKIENGRCGLLKKPYVVILRDKKPLPWLQRKQNRLGS